MMYKDIRIPKDILRCLENRRKDLLTRENISICCGHKSTSSSKEPLSSLPRLYPHPNFRSSYTIHIWLFTSNLVYICCQSCPAEFGLSFPMFPSAVFTLLSTFPHSHTELLLHVLLQQDCLPVKGQTQALSVLQADMVALTDCYSYQY